MLMKVKIGILVLMLLFTGGKKNMLEEGYVNVPGGRIWYRVIGSGNGIPLIAIHGGPGGRSCSMIDGFSLLADERPVVVYDQLESGNSDRPGDTSLWKLNYFVEELKLLVKALDLKEYHLLGSSWGAAILVEYMLTQDTTGVRSVIFSGPLLSTSQWIKDARVLLSRLPQNLQDTINKYEKLEDFNTPAYLAATDSFYSRFLSRNHLSKKRTGDNCKGVPGFNEKIYNYMWGPSEFTMRGTLYDFDRTRELHKIKQPVLYIIGEYDEVLPETAANYCSLTPHAELRITQDAAHAQLRDQPFEYTHALREFLNETESKK